MHWISKVTWNTCKFAVHMKTKLNWYQGWKEQFTLKSNCTFFLWAVILPLACRLSTWLWVLFILCCFESCFVCFCSVSTSLSHLTVPPAVSSCQSSLRVWVELMKWTVSVFIIIYTGNLDSPMSLTPNACRWSVRGSQNPWRTHTDTGSTCIISF